MAIEEVFAKPTVVQVIFEIKFPNFFSIESKIGDFQLAIMSKFPKSKLLFKQQFGFIQSVQLIKPPDSDGDSQTVNKIWQFKNEEEDITINVTSGSLDISSNKHKTYNNSGVSIEERFRETIDFVSGGFLKVVPLQKISRIGLRYIDKCPLPQNFSMEDFYQYYNSSIKFDSIDINNVDQIETYTSDILINRPNNIRIKRVEILTPSGPEYILDFDGMSFNINSSEYLKCLDDIHKEISHFYEISIKEPVYSYMRDLH